jgi:small GTP-binding protein
MSFLARSVSEDFMNDRFGGLLTTSFRPDGLTMDPLTKLSLDDDDATYANEDEEYDDFSGSDEDYEEHEGENREDGAAVSSSSGEDASSLDDDFYKRNPALVIVDPSLYSNYGTSDTGSGCSTPTVAYSQGFSHHSSSSSSSKLRSGSRSGPLREREVEVLKKGIEEAIKTKAPEVIQEERLEQIDAEEERATRAAISAASSPVSQHAVPTKRFKLLMLGDSGVGKSSLMIRWTEDTFSTDLAGTVGVNFKTKREMINNEMVHAQVWDTAGQEQFHKITTSYYKGAHGIMLVYDVSDPKSWDNVQYWLKNIRAHASESVQVVLVGNKCDLRADKSCHCVKPSLGKSFSKKFGVPYFETSAKSSMNVSQAFNRLLGSVLTVTEMIEKNNLAAKKLISDRLQMQKSFYLGDNNNSNSNSNVNSRNASCDNSSINDEGSVRSWSIGGIGEGGVNRFDSNPPGVDRKGKMKGDKCTIS